MELFRAHVVYVIADEIWSDILLDGHVHTPTQSVSEDARNRTTALYAPGKTFNLAGLIGSYRVVYNAWLRDRLDKEESLSHYNSQNVLSMHGLIGAYCEEGMAWTDELNVVPSENASIACEFFGRIPGVGFSRPQGTYMLFPDCAGWCEQNGATIDDLRRSGVRVGVLWQDGRAFGGEATIRLNLALPTERLREALGRLEEYVFVAKRWNQRERAMMVEVYRVAAGGAREGVPAPDGELLGPVAAAMGSGALALVPTETVYGVGVAVRAYAECGEMPPSATGYGRIFTLKRRDTAQTVPWLVSGAEELDEYGVDVPQAICDLAEAFWPGALTLVVPAGPRVPAFMRASDGTVALRASASPVVQELIRLCDSPLAMTSANTHGKPAPTSFVEVEPRILGGVDVAVDAGETPCRDASTIVAVQGGEVTILRQGALAAKDIYEALA